MIRPARWGRIRRGVLMLAVVGSAVTRGALAQCSMCGSAVGSSNRLGFGLNISILFLLTVLAASVGVVVFLAVRSGRTSLPPAAVEGVSPRDGGVPRRT